MKRIHALTIVLLCWSCFSVQLFGQNPTESAGTLSVGVRLVEVHAAVRDSRGHYLRGLESGQFQVLEDGRPQAIRFFEADSSGIALALLIDTTGSMVRVLPQVKNAAAQLLTSMKPSDSVGLYSFRNRLSLLQRFTQDHNLVLRALLATKAGGSTALFDSLAQLASDISRNSGKKAILLFTDGDDNSSLLAMEQAVQTVRRNGCPVYVVAQGQALDSKPLMERLREISKITGGMTFQVRKPDDISKVFNQIGADLQNLYRLAYYPARTDVHGWRKITVALPQQKGAKVRAKEGYEP